MRTAGKSWTEIQIATDLSYHTVRRYFQLAIGELTDNSRTKNSDKLQKHNPLITQQISIEELLG